MCEINWNLLLEYTKVLLSAPPVAALVFLSFMLKFKPEIGILILRIKRFHGVDLQDQTPVEDAYKKSAENSTANQSEAGKNIVTENTSPAIPEVETKIDPNRIPESLKNDPIAISQIQSAIDDPYEYVAEHKKISIALNFERIFAKIFGTQLSILIRLRDLSLKDDHLMAFYNKYKSLSESVEYPYSLYIGFLKDSGLIAEKTRDNESRYHLTQMGREFIDYVFTNYPGRWDSKPY